ncbi:MAG: transcription elongation factor GreB [Deltaproteobacteria bacterium]|nr:transcription elongation factor GreB [Deltaproteobacteria bacterium]
MSKAFIKEGDGSHEEEEPEIEEPAIPAGSKNYITPGGFKRLKEELHELLYKKRPEMTATVAWAAGNGDRSENADYIYGKRRLREIDRRIRFLTKRLDAAEVVDPSKRKSDQIFFGATVVLKDEEGSLKTYSIVGVDEIDFEKNHISWVSPLAKAILKKGEGDVVSFRSPKGPREIEIVEVRYEALQ